jgi:putative ABC transport system permease protein
MGELRSAIRALKSSPVPVGAAILTLALAIGINAGMVGLVDRALLSPPEQVADPDRVVTLAFERGDGDERVRMSTTSYVTYAAIRDHVSGFDRAAAWQRSSTTTTVEGEQIRADAMIVSGTYFEVLGAKARLGRPVQRDDDRAGAPPVVVLSQAFWKSAFGGDPGVLGRRVNVGGLEYTVSGVMPPRFSGHSPANVDMWMPFAAAMRQSQGWDQEAFRRIASIVARLAPGATMTAAATQAGAVVNTRVVLTPLGGADVSSADRRVAYWLTGVSALVLVIGLANAATLLLVRASRRRREFAIRAALGASRRRLLLQAFIEAAVVSIAATGVSLLLASWFDGAIRQVLLPEIAAGDGSGGTTLLAAASAGILAAIVTGIANASNLPGLSTGGSLDGGERPAFAKATAGQQTRLQSGLLVLQTALSVLLLAGAGMFGRSLYNLLAQDFGINMDNVVVVDIEPGPGAGTRGDLFDAALDRVRAVPGVRAATTIGAIPFSGFNVPPISVPGRAEPPGAGRQLPFLQAATPEFFDILGIRILEGRKFTAADDRGAPVVIVNETMARSVWPGESALGKCIRIGFDPAFDPETATGPPMPSAAVTCREVVGVAHDMRQRSVVPTENEERLMQYFVPFAQVPVPPFIPNPDRGAWGLLLRIDTDVAAVAPAIRRIVVGGRTDVPFIRVRPYAQLLDRQMRPWRLGTALLGLFSALALCVGAVGLYAAFSHAVTVRRREMAIRIAIGAQPIGVIGMILREALGLAGAGVLAGWIATIVGGRWLQSLLFDTSQADPIVLGGAGALMLAVAVVATILPARAASRANPAALLRA